LRFRTNPPEKTRIGRRFKLPVAYLTPEIHWFVFLVLQVFIKQQSV